MFALALYKGIWLENCAELVFCCLAIVRSELATARDIPATAKTHKSKCCNRAAAAWFASEDGQKWGAERRRLLHHGEPDAIISTRSSRVIAGANGTANGSRAAELAGSASSAPSAPPSASRIAAAGPPAPTDAAGIGGRGRGRGDAAPGGRGRGRGRGGDVAGDVGGRGCGRGDAEAGGRGRGDRSWRSWCCGHVWRSERQRFGRLRRQLSNQLRRHRRSGDPKNAGVLHLPTSKPSVPRSSQSVSKSEDRLGRADLTWTWNRLELKMKSRSALFVKSTHWSDCPGTPPAAAPRSRGRRGRPT